MIPRIQVRLLSATICTALALLCWAGRVQGEVFGLQSATSSGSVTCESYIIYDSVVTGDWSGTIILDSITASLRSTSQAHDFRMAIYSGDGTTLIDTTDEFNVPVSGFSLRSYPVEIGAELSANTTYILCAWCSSGPGSGDIEFTSDSTGHLFNLYSYTYLFATWPASLGSTATSADDKLVIYGTATVTGPGGSQVIIIGGN